jgi:hypothetical protein
VSGQAGSVFELNLQWAGGSRAANETGPESKKQCYSEWTRKRAVPRWVRQWGNFSLQNVEQMPGTPTCSKIGTSVGIWGPDACFSSKPVRGIMRDGLAIYTRRWRYLCPTPSAPWYETSLNFEGAWDKTVRQTVLATPASVRPHFPLSSLCAAGRK